MKVQIGNYTDDPKDREVQVQIDEWDTFNFDHTLSLIILPGLKQLKAQKHGSPNVDDEDVPEYLRSTAAKPKENEWDTDEFWHDRWEYVLDCIIWSFEQHVDHDPLEKHFYDFSEAGKEGDDLIEYVKRAKVDHEGVKGYQEQKQQGFVLFGKYFRAMWT